MQCFWFIPLSTLSTDVPGLLGLIWEITGLTRWKASGIILCRLNKRRCHIPARGLLSVAYNDTRWSLRRRDETRPYPKPQSRVGMLGNECTRFNNAVQVICPCAPDFRISVARRFARPDCLACTKPA